MERVAIGADEVRVHRHPSGCPTTMPELAAEGATSTVARGMTLEALLTKHGLGGVGVDLLKVDIEGAELAMFDQTPDSVLTGIAQLTVEYHDFIEPSHRPRINAIDSRLERLGFQRLNISRTPNLDVIYLRHDQHLSAIGRMWCLLRYKYLRGLYRISMRVLSRETA